MYDSQTFFSDDSSTLLAKCSTEFVNTHNEEDIVDLALLI
jgi:hypothetical protein